MPRVKCYNCPNYVTVRYRRWKEKGDNYIAFCHKCYNSNIRPEGFRCQGITHAGKRCNAWNDYNNGSKYCRSHKSQGDENNE